jgi:phosphotransferase system enzyme I (PtsI)
MVQNTQQVKKSISICGEMAADLYAIPLLVGIGIESFSVNASSIPHIKKIIRNLSYKEARKLAKKCLKFSTESEIKSTIKKYYDDHFKEEIEEIFH